MVKWFLGRKGARETLKEEHYRKLGTPAAIDMFIAEFEKDINAWAEADVDASEREDGRFSRVTETIHKARSNTCVRRRS